MESVCKIKGRSWDNKEIRVEYYGEEYEFNTYVFIKAHSKVRCGIYYKRTSGRGLRVTIYESAYA